MSLHFLKSLTILISALLFSCNQHTNTSLKNDIINLIDPSNSIKNYVAIIISDTDCTSCFEKITDYKNSDNLMYKEFLISRDTSAFKTNLA